MEFEKLVKLARHCSAKDACIKCAVGGCSGPTGLMSRLADAIDELLKAAKAMHTWIFLNAGDEQAAYDDCGLSDELNAALGYCGAFEMLLDRPKEEKDDVG